MPIETLKVGALTNPRSANSWFIQISSDSAKSSTYLSEANLKLVGVIYTLESASDVIKIYDLAQSSPGPGLQKLAPSETPGTTNHLELADSPIVFPNGVWVSITRTVIDSTYSTNPSATLIFQ